MKPSEKISRRTLLAAGSTAIIGTAVAQGQEECQQPGATILHEATVGEIAENYLQEESLFNKLEQYTDYHHWWASSPSLGHQSGERHSNKRWWTDPCEKYNSSKWTCFGPYVNLERGTYDANWIFFAEGSSVKVSMDAVALVGRHRLVKETVFKSPSGRTMQASFSFTLREDLDDVEVRFRWQPGTDLLICKYLEITRTY